MTYEELMHDYSYGLADFLDVIRILNEWREENDQRLV